MRQVKWIQFVGFNEEDQKVVVPVLFYKKGLICHYTYTWSALINKRVFKPTESKLAVLYVQKLWATGKFKGIVDADGQTITSEFK
ncbi:hypothetical protein AO468_00220 [Oenococcus oeni]|uniref:hypothetical protein n=1 Tax=Oenococcus oeni TaxID=1247 RepID=UPI00050FE2B5|nr:hypothetical protein [Oenococcus oeni]KGH65291.1 hypothetical protein X291_06525 [Oenococcus oeni IOEB_C23]KGH71341.1 hypothetical protein X280_09020 [Oenococcus oeni IOEB_0502]PDH94072.1 hypothetical protein AO468_00220 [Oenococcus oeni]